VTPLVHWDEAASESGEVGHLGGTWTDLGEAAGSVAVGLNRIQVPEGKWSTPAHVELGEEEIFYVLAGSGVSLQGDEAYEVGAGDCLAHLIGATTHTLRAGAVGLDVLAFGMRTPPGGTYLPRAGVVRMDPGTAVARADKHAWELEAEAGEPEVPPLSERPGTIVAAGEVPADEFGAGGDVQSFCRDLGEAVGSVRTGLNLVSVPPGKLGAPPHCHSAEEELFIVLEGDGTLLLGEDEHPVRAGHVVARPAGTGVAHALRSGPGGLSYLAYGTREPNDIAFYPRSGKVSFRGVRVIARLERLEYWDGEVL
jgi:uncharacterized cupin superfamily protein